MFLSVLSLFDSTYALAARQFGEWATAAHAAIPRLLASVIVALAFIVLARLTARPLRKLFARMTANTILAGLFAGVASLAITLTGLFLALTVLRLDQAVLSLLAGLGLMGLALGFAFQDIAANFFSGILLAARQPFRIGDLVEAVGYTGTVVQMNLRSTVIKTFQGPEVILPNRKLLDSPLTNFSSIPKRRVDVKVGVGYDDDLTKVEAVTRAALEALPLRDAEVAVDVWFETFGDNAVQLTANFWIDLTAGTNILAARSSAVAAIHAAYAEAGITIPYPTWTLLQPGAPPGAAPGAVEEKR